MELDLEGEIGWKVKLGDLFFSVEWVSVPSGKLLGQSLGHLCKLKKLREERETSFAFSFHLGFGLPLLQL